MATTIEAVNILDLAHFTTAQAEAAREAEAHQYTLFGGCRGPGKSYWLRWYMLCRLLRFQATGTPSPVVGLFTESYPALKDRQIGPITAEFPRWLGELRDSQAHGLGFHLRSEYGSGILALRNLDDPAKYQSAEFAAIGVDELTRVPRATFDLLRGSLRWPGVERPRFAATANPGGIGHAWVKAFWIDRAFPEEMRPLAGEFCFVRALPTDNPHLAPSYWQMLETLPPDLARAWRWGDWDIFAGQVFAEWRPEVHVVEPFDMPRQWLRFRAIDYGYAAPSAVLWLAADERNNLYAYRELYESGLSPVELAEAIRQQTPADEHISYTVADPSLFKVNEQSRQSNASVMATNGAPCQPGANDRLSGWRMLHEYLRVTDDMVGGRLTPTARLKVWATCRNLIRTLPALVYDERRSEDVDSAGEDHLGDALRYGVMSRPAVRLHTDPVLTAEAELSRLDEAHRRKWKHFERPPVSGATGRSSGW